MELSKMISFYRNRFDLLIFNYYDKLSKICTYGERRYSHLYFEQLRNKALSNWSHDMNMLGIYSKWIEGAFNSNLECRNAISGVISKKRLLDPLLDAAKFYEGAFTDGSSISMNSFAGECFGLFPIILRAASEYSVNYKKDMYGLLGYYESKRYPWRPEYYRMYKDDGSIERSRMPYLYICQYLCVIASRILTNTKGDITVSQYKIGIKDIQRELEKVDFHKDDLVGLHEGLKALDTFGRSSFGMISRHSVDASMNLFSFDIQKLDIRVYSDGVIERVNFF